MSFAVLFTYLLMSVGIAKSAYEALSRKVTCNIFILEFFFFTWTFKSVLLPLVFRSLLIEMQLGCDL